MQVKRMSRLDDALGRFGAALDRLEASANARLEQAGASVTHLWDSKLRPHFKSHKCVTLARRQLESGSAVGITCAKLAEAEMLVAGGVKDVLGANQVVGAPKAQRLAALNRGAAVRSAVDSAVNVAELGAAALDAGVIIGVLIEVDIGMRRCGVPPGEPAVALARTIQNTRGLRFDGLQAYEGHLVTLPNFEERRQKVTEAMHPLLQTRQSLQAADLPCQIVSGGGTGTYDITGNLEVFDEVQAGSYALMDNSYKVSVVPGAGGYDLPGGYPW